jgi:hypothetical protein
MGVQGNIDVSYQNGIVENFLSFFDQALDPSNQKGSNLFFCKLWPSPPIALGRRFSMRQKIPSSLIRQVLVILHDHLRRRH